MDAVIAPEVLSPPPGLIAMHGARFVGRQELRTVQTPPMTATHVPISHADVVEALIETLGFRKLTVVNDRYALGRDGARMFGVLQVNVEESGVRFCVGIRNSHDKSFSLGLVVGYTTLVCDNLSFVGDFEPVLRKHTRGVNIRDVLALGVEASQRAWEPITRRIDAWSNYQLTDDQARLIIYRAFIERDGIELPRHLGPMVHQEYMTPSFEAFRPRTLRSLEAAFTHAVKRLDPVPQFQATAAVGAYFQQFS
jgi:hypothetical protein